MHREKLVPRAILDLWARQEKEEKREKEADEDGKETGLFDTSDSVTGLFEVELEQRTSLPDDQH